ncbi:response regulator [Pseudomonas viridiflava]|uniref:response regulator n=1 Tax=Pseudomonas viridiflava TaxID=33069 RepID=UPI000F06298D|nr:response regulator [Pseudomonas viridiflava]
MRILLIEDDPILAMIAAATLSAEHQIIGPAHDVSHAMKLAREQQADVAFVDINLGGHDEGIALARRLRDQHGINSVFISGQVQTARANADAALGLLRKPYAPGDLAHCAQVTEALLDGSPFGSLPAHSALEIFRNAPLRKPMVSPHEIRT